MILKIEWKPGEFGYEEAPAFHISECEPEEGRFAWYAKWNNGGVTFNANAWLINAEGKTVDRFALFQKPLTNVGVK